MYSLVSQNEAKYTTAIAMDSKRDSTAVRTITIMTILFLPGTFVATFFSMDMVDWKPSDGSSPKLSSYMWVYWIISIPLTIVVLGSWMVWSRMVHDKAQVRLKTHVGLMGDFGTAV